MTEATTETGLVCSFCGKTQQEVRKLIAGPKVYICDECITLSADIISEDVEKRFPEVSAAEDARVALERAVVGQSRAIDAVVGALRQHLVGGLEGGALPTPTLLLAGPAGCGKTMLARALVDATPLPSFLGDINRVTATGYVGEDIEGFLSELRDRAGSDAAHARRGVLAVDNIDHLVPKSPPVGTARDVSGTEVQRALLRILEGQSCQIFNGQTRHPQSSWQPFSTGGLMRVLFATTPSEPTADDVRDQLRELGITPTLLSRVHVIVPMRALSREDLHEALTRRTHGLLPKALAFLERAHVTLSVGLPTIERIVERALASDDAGWSLERQVAGIVHDVAARGASGRLLFTLADLERIGA